MALVVIKTLLCPSEQYEEQIVQDRGVVPGSAQPRDGLRDADAQEVEVAQPGELEQDLLEEEVVDGVARRADRIGDVGVATALIYERCTREPQRDASTTC